MADAGVSKIRFGFIAQSGDGCALPGSLRVFKQGDQRASIDGGGGRQPAEFGQCGVDIQQGHEPFRHVPSSCDSRRAKHQQCVGSFLPQRGFFASDAFPPGGTRDR